MDTVKASGADESGSRARPIRPEQFDSGEQGKGTSADHGEDADTGPWFIGKTVGGMYQIRGVLGRGGFGIVYLAYDTATHRLVAVKVPLGGILGHPGLRKRLVREAEVWTQLIHPHIVHAFDVRDGDQSTEYLLAVFMEYCDGRSLAERLCKGLLPMSEGLDIAIQVCWAMEFAHRFEYELDGRRVKGFLHRDLKPHNVLLTREGKALVSDFGLVKPLGVEELEVSEARSGGEGARREATFTRGGVGTPEYMAPEQWEGEVSVQSDVYAFGIMLYEVFCGVRPFAPDQRDQLKRMHAEVPAPPPQRLKAGIPSALAKLMVGCVAKDPLGRPGSFREVAGELARVYEQLVGKRYALHRPEPTAVEVTREQVRQRAWALIRLGNGCQLRGDLDEGLRHYRKASETFCELGDKDGLQASLGNQALILKARGDLDGAMKLLKEQEQICRELGDKHGLQASLGSQANILYARGELDGAMKLHKQKEQICRELGDKAGLSRSLVCQALILSDRGDLDGAMKLHKQAEQICRELGDKAGLQACLGNQANILYARGELDGAMKLHKQEEQICRELGDKAGLSRSLGNQAVILYARGDLDGAMKLHKQAEQICRELGDKAGLQTCLGNQANILYARGDLDGAMKLLKEQEQICRELGDKAGLSASLGNQALILRARGDLDGAMKLHKQAEQICRELGDVNGLAISLINQAILLGRIGVLREALPLAEEAYRLAASSGLTALAGQIQGILDRIRVQAG